MARPYQIGLGFPEQCRQKGAVTLSLPSLRPIHVVFALVLAAFAAVLVAQIEGERGIAPLASQGDFEVKDIRVDVAGPNADAARATGWRLAQRLAWQSLWKRTHGGNGPALGDSVLDGLVSGIEVQQEQIGPNRYIATLSVMFDRARAGQALGVSGQIRRSPPLLVIPVLWDSGTPMTFERVTPWQKAWAEFRISDSPIDYVRTAGDGPDSLLLNPGQIGRRGRNWWRILLDLYGAADVIMPIARIERSFPGGPITGHFSARYGPDNNFIGDFTLRAATPADLPKMMSDAVARIDQLYAGALADGTLRLDPSLVIEEPVNAVEIENAVGLEAILGVLPADTPGAASFSVQIETPTTASVGEAQAMLRGIPGVSAASTSSLALGGTSVMQVGFSGTIEQLRAQLEGRGYSVAVSGNTLRIARRGASPPAGGGGGGQ
ncbi:heavy-metal-associated domain-containing protein [Sphingobium sp. B12D2B]|uniref:heavy-metal-associated domain-containing protein n=1 Tax=Sphingobium sp. B12D2B TaxID=2940577 RepID=UPI0022241C48|nr:heavy-metal-associated domain-containing protein [Sphingobium sp. B12D2B]